MGALVRGGEQPSASAALGASVIALAATGAVCTPLAVPLQEARGAVKWQWCLLELSSSPEDGEKERGWDSRIPGAPRIGPVPWESSPRILCGCSFSVCALRCLLRSRQSNTRAYRNPRTFRTQGVHLKT